MTSIFWVGYSVLPAARNPKVEAVLVCGPYCHWDQARAQADAMSSPDMPFEVFSQSIAVRPTTHDPNE